MSVQKGWRRCLQCAGLFYPGGPHACPRGGEHTSQESSEFMPRTAGGPGTQDKWRWCKRCGGLFYGRLTVWVQGTSRSVDLWCITLADPARMTWHSDLVPTANGIWNDPAVVPLPDSLGGGAWVFYERAMDNLGGRGSSGRIVRLDTKSGVTEEVSVSASGSPGAVMFNSSVYLFHEGKGGDGRLWSTKLIPTDNGKGATRGGGPGRVEAPMRMSAVPAPVVDGGRLYVFTEGPGDNGELWFGGSAHGTVFDGNGPIAGVGCSTGCGATRFRFAT